MNTRTAFPAIVLLALALSACAGDPVSSGEASTTSAPTTSAPTTSPTTTIPVTTTILDRSNDLAALETAEGRWAETDLTTYAYTYRQSCECDDAAMGPNTVLVVDGTVASVRLLRQGTEGFDPNVVAPPGHTVPDLFDMIRASIDREEQISVTYDEVLGHPLVVRLDLEAIPVDGGFDFAITSFEAGSPEREALDAARDRWAAAGPSDYSYVYRPQCFCIPSEIQVMVAAGEIQSHEVLEGEVFGDVLSIEALFGFIEEAIAGQAFSIDVEYDETLGHPTSVWVDYEENMADEEMGYTVELTAGG